MSALICTLLLGAGPARAEPPAPGAPTPLRPEATRASGSTPWAPDAAVGASVEGAVDDAATPMEPGALAVAAALVPGVLVHGMGHLVGGDAETFWDLLAVEAVGLGAAIGGLGAIAATGASRRFVGPLTAVTVLGGGLFTQSLLADLYGSAGGSLRGASPQRITAWVEAQAGYQYVYDPQFSYRSFATLAVDARLGAWRVSPRAWIALDDVNQRLRLEAAWRAIGPVADDDAAAPVDGSSLEVEGATTYHNFSEADGFSTLMFESTLRGRYDMARLSASLEGSFATAWLGLGLRLYDYDVPGLALGDDTGTQLLGGFGYGLYLGQGDGEVHLYYDHRRDGFAAAMGTEGIGVGVIGHVGLDATWYVNERWGARLESKVGSAYIAGLSVMHRYGGRPR